jgi:microcystin-dependent protein
LAVQRDSAEEIDRAGDGHLKQHPKELDHMKRFFLLVALAAGLISPAFAAGTIPGISMSQQLDSLGNPLNGGKLYLIQAGTTSTPQNCYQDSGLTIAWPNPITLDSAGRIPQLFCADGSIKIRLTNSAGVQQLVQDNLLVVGPSGGGGGGGTVDATTVLATGDMKVVYGSGPLTGFVRCNGRTIGSASSGASERANADVQALFEYFWGVDANLSVSGGRGASANADWVANKTMALPDCRGRVIAGDDAMGNSAAGRLTDAVAGFGNGLGETGGNEKRTLETSNLPPYTPTVASATVSVTSTASFQNTSAGNVSSNFGGGATDVPRYNPGVVSSTGSASITMNAQGGTSTPFVTVQPTIVMTFYIKL